MAQPKEDIFTDNIRPLLGKLPDWLPEATRAYLVHTESGASIRAVARAIGAHPSTILRQIRRLETRRDDPLVDDALDTLGQNLCAPQNNRMTDATQKIAHEMGSQMTPKAAETLAHFSISGTVLALAQDLDNAVVVRDGLCGSTDRLAVVDRSVAMALAMQDWITPDNPGNHIVRYRITPAGRIALRDSNVSANLPDAPVGPLTQIPPAKHGRRYGAPDTPLMHLSRHKDTSGSAFLSDECIQAGERIREDYELAMLDQNRHCDWESYIKGTDIPDPNHQHTAAAQAHFRVATALANLGPELGDVVYVCCCQLEGLEGAEKQLGWAARSGKIVLRIGLLHLARHYETHAPNALIG